MRFLTVGWIIWNQKYVTNIGNCKYPKYKKFVDTSDQFWPFFKLPISCSNLKNQQILSEIIFSACFWFKMFHCDSSKGLPKILENNSTPCSWIEEENLEPSHNNSIFYVKLGESQPFIGKSYFSIKRLLAMVTLWFQCYACFTL